MSRGCAQYSFFPILVFSTVGFILTSLLWVRYSDELLFSQWSEFPSCTVVDTQVQSSTTDPDQYRSVVNVLLTPSSSTISEALRYVNGVYNQTQEQAEAYNERFLPSSVITCYRNRFSVNLVSVEEMKNTDVDASYLVSAIVATVVLAVLVGVLLVLMIRLRGGHADESRDQNFPLDSFGIESGHNTHESYPVKRGGGLSHEKAHELCDAYRVDPPKDVEGDEWVCAICLEQYEFEHKSLVLLPCAHKYHGKCLRRWIRKGGNCCCLCNAPLEDFVPSLTSQSALKSHDLTSVVVS
eukprot:CAMPEP_0182444296 /NCGR_PEP_ID=MMETSP1172-20130603/2794_1 /TAXON_ID=708627 /ORGANISM="Timspurckia oligopyrenoides, Strain CCMP3278" /LENGTH=295 /DNA_ID=CAMNT_0024639823 /DNA_START=154 /DNA_END=1041 /DNA_ORIENTATION=-